MKSTRGLDLRVSYLVFLFAVVAAPGVDGGGALLLEKPFKGLGPEGITHDPTDNTFWVTSAIDPVIRHFDAQLNLLGSIPAPFPGSDAETGIAYSPSHDSLLVVNPTTFELVELDKTGALTPLFTLN